MDLVLLSDWLHQWNARVLLVVMTGIIFWTS
uniref:Clustered mitochondria protein-like n=1 Tax=Rhizophora mucronata TaxID=61149 RepID=A0A2P2QFM4_RHIMU